MSTDETYLESFTESISTLPNELKRNLAHMKTLDVSYGEVVEELRAFEEDYLQHAYSIISQHPVQSKEQLLLQAELEKQRKRRKLEDEETDSNNDSNDNDNATGNNTTTSSSSESKKEKQESKSSTKNSKSDTKENKKDQPKYLFDVNYGIPVQTTPMTKNSISSSATTTTTTTTSSSKKQDGKNNDESKENEEETTVLVIPTTEELNYQIRNHEHLLEIAKLRTEARQLSNEKVAVANQVCALIDAQIQRLDADLEKFESLLKNTGQYQETISGRNGGIAKPDDLAAIQVMPNSPDWILAKVITHDPNTQMYKLADEDIESNKTFTLPESQVVILGIGGLESTRKGDVIYAVYPDTTSFYQATVVQGPKKVAGGEPFVLVHFKDDGDENGITHDKAVLMKHIMRVPYGAIQ